MAVPNAITRVINKEGKVVAFNLSRIHKSITSAITDIEHSSTWEAKERALLYSEKVKDRAHRDFYNLDYLVEFFSRMIVSFDPSEIQERVERAEFGKRIATLFLLNYTHENKLEALGSDHKKEVTDYVKKYFNKNIKDEKLANNITDLFTQKIFDKQEEGIFDTDKFPTREYLQDIIETVLKDVGEVITAEGFMVYREGRLKIKANEISEEQFTHDGIHRDRLRETLLWNIKNECDSVFGLNDWVIGKDGKDFNELIRRCDQRFDDDISKVVKKIMSRSEGIKVVTIAGPSCSNKTTTTTILEKELKKEGLKLKQLNIDDYFLNLSQHPKDEFGDYDYEMPEAIDLKLLNENLRDLLAGKTIKKPSYNFKTGMRDGHTDFSLAEDEIILIDCLHGLFGPLTEAVPTSKKFKIYTESSNVLRGIDGSYTKWTDVRLAKRMVRDSLFRNHPIDKTLAHWIYVRKGELKHIIPYVYSVDAVLNAGLPYELPILKSVLKDRLPSPEALRKLRYEGRLDAYIRGIRLNTLFDTIIAYNDLDDIDGESPIREFIGGSSYEIAHNE